MWIQVFSARPAALVRLFCFSYAGGGASAYRLWHAGLPPEIEVCAIQLPGRESRLNEAPMSSIDLLVGALVPHIRARADRRFAFFGHSMGATLACEVARELQAAGGPVPQHLFVSARRPSSMPDPDPPLARLPDAAFVVELNRRYGSIPAEVLQHEELMALLLPGLRADLLALEGFRPPSQPLLAMPVTAFGGLADARAPHAQLDAWRAQTTGSFALRQFPGDHFYLNPQRDALLSDIRTTLAPLLVPSAERVTA